VWGSTLVLKLLDRFPVVVAFGAGLLGWIAGGLIVNDPVGDRWPVLDTPPVVYGASIAGALFVVAIGYALRKRRSAPHAH
jgi:predicted tellurium resistance membrane protein TerC